MSAKAQGVTVYQSDIYYYPDNSYAILPVASGTETGDEVTLAGTQRFVTGFSFNYWGSSLPGNATAEVRFYDTTSGTPSGAPLFDSGAFSIGNTSGKQLTFTQSDLGGGFNGKDEMTWTVTFNYSSGSAALFAGGVTPTVGGSYADYWAYANGGWTKFGNNAAPGSSVNFASTITAVPEPGTMALLGIGGLAGMILVRRRK